MKILDLEKAFTDELTQLYDFEEARNLAWLSISNVCRFNRMQYLAAKQNELQESQVNTLYQILTDLKACKPLQYILGETEFYGLTLKVNPSVLIPRPETEELVDWIIKDAKDKNLPAGLLNTLDIGTGSGCIPIALKKNLPQAKLSAIDISAEAIKTAIINAVMNDAEVNYYIEDIFNPKHSVIINGVFDIIVSNPPYVTRAEKKKMHQNVLDFEPHTALFVDDEDPLKFYQSIAAYAHDHLPLNGKLYLEINESLGVETVDLLKQRGFENIELRSDLRGRQRMIKAEKNLG